MCHGGYTGSYWGIEQPYNWGHHFVFCIVMGSILQHSPFLLLAKGLTPSFIGCTVVFPMTHTEYYSGDRFLVLLALSRE
jgi:hypothetical protein